MARPTAEERRRDYLNIGLDMIRDLDIAHPREVTALADIRVSDVARRANVTKGALYHIWPSQESFRQDLLGYLLDQRAAAEEPATTKLAAAAATGDLAAIREPAQQLFDDLRVNQRYLARFGFLLFADSSEVQPLVEHAARLDLADFEPAVAKGLEALGRRPKAPFTVETVVSVLASTFNGLLIQSRWTPAQVRPDVTADEHGEWGLWPIVARSVIEYYTEPVND